MAMPVSVPTYTVRPRRFPDDGNRYELLDGDDRAILVSRPGEAPDHPYRDQLQWSPRGLGQTFVIDIEPLFRGLE